MPVSETARVCAVVVLEREPRRQARTDIRGAVLASVLEDDHALEIAGDATRSEAQQGPLQQRETSMRRDHDLK